MTFLTILLVLFIDRVLWDVTPHRQHAWFDNYLGWLNQDGRLNEKSWGVALILLPILVLLGWLQTSLLPYLGGLFEMSLAGLVLLFSLGPRDLGRDADRYLGAKDSEKTRMAGYFRPKADTKEPDRSVVDGLLVGACRRLIAPIFWFSLFGPVGAAAYRLTQLLSESLQTHDNLTPLAQATASVAYVLDWAPIRVTAAGFAIAGNFDAVASAWKACSNMGGETECPNDESFLLETGYAALQAGGERADTLLIEDALALVWRNLTLWVAFAGAVTLLASL